MTEAEFRRWFEKHKDELDFWQIGINERIIENAIGCYKDDHNHYIIYIINAENKYREWVTTKHELEAYFELKMLILFTIRHNKSCYK